MQEKATFSKRIRLFFILLFVVMSNSAFSQDKLEDNWEEELSKAQGQERIDLIFQLSKKLLKTDLDNAERIAKEGIELTAELGDSSSFYKISVNLGMIYCHQNELTKGLAIARKSLNYYDRLNAETDERARAQFGLSMLLFESGDYKATDSLLIQSEHIFKKSNNQKGIRDIYARQGYHFIIRKEYPIAKDYLTKALRLNEQIPDSDLPSTILMNLGIVERNLGNLPEAVELYFQVLNMETDDFLKAKCLSNISGLYQKLEEWDTALEYAEKSLILKERIGGEASSIAYSLFAIGVIHKKMLNYGQAMSYFERCLSIRKKIEGNHSRIDETLVSIGNLHVALGAIEKAMELYDEALELSKSNNNWSGVCNALYNKGYTLYKVEDYQAALAPLADCYELALEKENLHYLEISCAVLSNCNNELGNTEIAEFYETQYYTIRDSVFDIPKVKKIGSIEQQYKNDIKKDSLTNTLVSYEKKAENDRRNLYLYSIGALTFLFIGVVVYLKYRGQSKKNKETISAENSNNISNKLDHYFEEILHRFEQNGYSAKNEEHENNGEASEISNMATFLVKNLSTENEWKSFEHYFTKVHKDFFKHLKTSYPNISTNELNLCALLKLNIPNKEIAQIMGISYNSVRKAQHRLAKKLIIPSNQVLRDFIIKL